ncbi:MAG: DegV family protein [Chloroflexota bacterium]
MPKIAIVTDSSANIPPELLSQYNITIVPLVLIWDEKIYQDGIDIQANEFYDKLVQSDTIPTTSQATIPTFMKNFKYLSEQGFDILTIVISSKLSGTLDSAIQAKKALPDANIELVDSLTTSVPLAMLVVLVAKAAKNGATLAECKALAEKALSKIHLFFAVDTLEYLHKGGRIGGAARFLGTALGLKPILELSNGVIEARERVRTSKKAHARLLELVGEVISDHKPLNSIGIIAANAPDVADFLLNECKTRFKPQEIMLGTLSPAIGTHTGPGTVGVGILAGLEDDLIK